jgi:hypothetical protein
MKRIGLMIGFLAVLAFLLPLTAQDVKKDADKTDKTDAKKDADKKDDPKDPDKKDVKKEKEPEKKKEKLVYGAKFQTKIVNVKGETNREYTIEVQETDPKKVYDFKKWQSDRSVAQQQFNISRINPKDFQGRANAVAQYQRDMATFQIDTAKRSTQLTTGKNVEVRATETAKVRTMIPPVEFDDSGKQIVWTKKALDERRDKTGLPGFPVEFDSIKSGQYVEIYMAKVTPAKKDDTKKKKGPNDDDPLVTNGPMEFVLIVIMAEGKQ